MSVITIRDRIEQLLHRERIPGCAVIVVDATGTRYAETFGLANLASGAAVHLDTVWPLFSGTKLFTATAVMQAMERDELSLEQRIGTWLPALPPFAAELTVRELLSHTSGLDDALRAVLAVRWREDALLTSMEALAQFPLRRARPARGHVRYRNMNYALLAAVLSTCTGIEYTDLVRERILLPLGAELRFDPDDAWWARAASAYMDRFDPMRLVLRLLLPDIATRVTGPRHGKFVRLTPYRVATPAIGGLFGTVPAFARFLQAHLRDGEMLLSSESARLMRDPVARGAAGIMSRDAVGLGWKIGSANGEPFVNHEGGGAGGTTELRLYPQRGIGVALAMNVMRMPGTMRVAHDISELVRGA